jgi:histidine ammonia-lyase
MMYAIGVSLESMLVITSAYHPLVHKLKGQLVEVHVNQFLLEFWTGSQLLTDLDELRASGEKPVQDYYSLRAVAQGFGPFYENLERASKWIENEMTASTTIR